MRMAIEAAKHRRGSSPPFQLRAKRRGDRLQQGGEPGPVALSFVFIEPMDLAGDDLANNEQSVDEARWQNEGGTGNDAVLRMRFPHSHDSRG